VGNLDANVGYARIIVFQVAGRHSWSATSGRVKSMLPRLNSASFAAMLLISGLPIHAQIAGPFVGVAGSWAGGGVVALATGAKERLRCRAAYKMGGDGHTLQLSMRCVSANYNFHLTGSVVEPGGTVSGRLEESGQKVAGNVSGRASAGTIEAIASGDSFSAGITLIMAVGHDQAIGW
jgi:hypothetical protein